MIQSHVATGVSAHGLEDVLDVYVLAQVFAGHDGAAIDKDRRDVKTGDGHHAAGHVFVAAGDGDEGVHPLSEGNDLDGVRDDFPADQGGFHALRPHGDAVADGDSPELEGHSVGLADPFLGGIGQPVQMNVARRDVAGQVSDGHEGFVHVGGGQAHGPEHGPGRGPVWALGYLFAAMLES